MRFVILAIVIFSFFKPFAGSILFIAVAAILELWVIIANKNKIKVKNDNNKYTWKEIEVIERYRLFFSFPFASRQLSAAFSGIQLAVFPLVPWFLYKGLYIQAVIIGLNYFITTQLSVILNPQFFLHDNLDKGKIKNPKHIAEYTEDMKAIDSALVKMYEQKDAPNKVSSMK